MRIATDFPREAFRFTVCGSGVGTMGLTRLFAELTVVARSILFWTANV
ncbi:MAG: hypothetical protein AB8G99_16595 [Planctomycetaceae bacterium]